MHKLSFWTQVFEEREIINMFRPPWRCDDNGLELLPIAPEPGRFEDSKHYVDRGCRLDDTQSRELDCREVSLIKQALEWHKGSELQGCTPCIMDPHSCDRMSGGFVSDQRKHTWYVIQGVNPSNLLTNGTNASEAGGTNL
jgi:hypothetical protein